MAITDEKLRQIDRVARATKILAINALSSTATRCASICGSRTETVASHATAVRAGGDVKGEPIGALGVFFDWGPQSDAIVRGVRMSTEEWERTRCVLLDASGRVIAASDGRGVLDEHIDLVTGGADAGFYTDPSGAVVGFSLTPGYETYEGLGWYGAIIQRPQQHSGS